MGMCFLTPKASPVRTDTLGQRSIAIEFIAAGETVAAFGGRCVTREELVLPNTNPQPRALQIDEDIYMVGTTEPLQDGFINHRCDPNCGMRGAVLVVALRDIEPGEELSYDLAMCDGDTDNEFACDCGAATCRGLVTGHDWMRPDLQLQYRGYFSPFLARRIAELAPVGAERRAFAY